MGCRLGLLVARTHLVLALRRGEVRPQALRDEEGRREGQLLLRCLLLLLLLALLWLRLLRSLHTLLALFLAVAETHRGVGPLPCPRLLRSIVKGHG